jgi:hypothetical protein
MSIYYSLQLATAAAPAEVSARLAASEDDGASADAGAAESAFVTVRGYDPDPVDDQLYVHAYGFAPRVGVVVELDKFAPGVREREAPAMRVLRALLRRTDADLYVSHLGDYPVLVRRRGSIVVDARWAAQRPWLAAELPFPYALGTLVDPYAEAA